MTDLSARADQYGNRFSTVQMSLYICTVIGRYSLQLDNYFISPSKRHRDKIGQLKICKAKDSLKKKLQDSNISNNFCG